MNCGAKDCEAKAIAKGLCSKHYQQARRGPRRPCCRHGHNRDGANRTTYDSWSAMRQRCGNPNNPAFPRYGGRGISVCKRWEFFSNFLEDMGEKPNGTTLDRIDTNGGYCPENCRWASPVEQANNTRRNRRMQFNGKLMTLAEIGRVVNLPAMTIRGRLARGATLEDAVKPGRRKSGPKPRPPRSKEEKIARQREADKRHRNKDPEAYKARKRKEMSLRRLSKKQTNN